MTHPLDEITPGQAAGKRFEHAARHPLQSAEHEVGKLKEVADRGESAATPAILTVTWIAIVLPLAAIVVALAFGAAYLVTGSAGTRYPARPSGTQMQTTADARHPHHVRLSAHALGHRQPVQPLATKR